MSSSIMTHLRKTLVLDSQHRKLKRTPPYGRFSDGFRLLTTTALRMSLLLATIARPLRTCFDRVCNVATWSRYVLASVTWRILASHTKKWWRLRALFSGTGPNLIFFIIAGSLPATSAQRALATLAHPLSPRRV